MTLRLSRSWLHKLPAVGVRGCWQRSVAGAQGELSISTWLTSCIAAAQSALVDATESWIELLVAELVHLYPNLKPQVRDVQGAGGARRPTVQSISCPARHQSEDFRSHPMMHLATATASHRPAPQTELKQLAKRCLDLKAGTKAAFLPPLHILHPVLVVRRRTSVGRG